MLSIVLGLMVGCLIALTGAGGSLLSVPLLVFALHLPVSVASPISLLAVATSAGVVSIMGLWQGLVRYRAAIVMAIAGIIVTPLGVYAQSRLPNSLLTALFALILVGVAVRFFRHGAREKIRAKQSPEESADYALMPLSIKTAPCQLDEHSGRFRWTLSCTLAMLGTGGVTGLLSGMFGVGGGFVLVPTLQHTTNAQLKTIVATSLAVIALVSIAGVAYAISTHRLNFSIASPFVGGAVVGALIGRTLSGHWPAWRISQAFALLTLLCAGLMLMRSIAP